MASLVLNARRDEQEGIVEHGKNSSNGDSRHTPIQGVDAPLSTSTRALRRATYCRNTLILQELRLGLRVPHSRLRDVRRTQSASALL